MTSGTRQVTLIGAGPAGSLLALLLARRGYRVTVFERRPDLRSGDVSGGISINLALANRGISALEEAGVMDEVRKLLIPMRGRMLHDEQGELQLQPYGSRPEEVIHSVSRHDLTAVLIAAAEATGAVEIHFLQRCTGIDFHADQLQLEHTGDGTTSVADFETVIGTDGSSSAVRTAVLDAGDGQFDRQPLGHSYKELLLPAGPGGEFQIEKQALHIWPRGEFMLIALPNLDGSFTVTLFLPNEGNPSFASLDGETAVQAFFEENFADFVPLVPDLSSQFLANRTGTLATVRVKGWSFKDRALILGDAAHAVVPFHGQGMNAAFESVLTTVRCIERLGDDWQAVFGEVERLRKPNTDAIADMALENYIEMRSTVRDPRYQLKKQLAFELEARFPERFIPRYSMVMFHRLPYAEAQRRGVIQQQILDELAEGCSGTADVDYALAAQMIDRLLQH